MTKYTIQYNEKECIYKKIEREGIQPTLKDTITVALYDMIYEIYGESEAQNPCYTYPEMTNAVYDAIQKYKIDKDILNKHIKNTH